MSAQWGKDVKAEEDKRYTLDPAREAKRPMFRYDVPVRWSLSASLPDKGLRPLRIWNHFPHALQTNFRHPLRTPFRMTRELLQTEQW